jgi:hypothetical protein
MRRQRRISQSRAVALAVLVACAALPGGTAWAGPGYTTRFPLERCTFEAGGRNAHFSIQPGFRLFLAGDDDGEEVKVLITVLDRTRRIRFVTERGVALTVRTRVVEEREWKDGELVEVSRNFYARCKETNDVYYFGEDVDIYEDGVVVSHDGAWLAGQAGALPGLIMPGTFLLGSRYFQERASGIAEDRAEHVAMGLTVETPAGTFHDCVEVVETSALEPGAESIKRYCPGIGLVVDDPIELVGVDFAPDDDDDGDDD